MVRRYGCWCWQYRWCGGVVPGGMVVPGVVRSLVGHRGTGPGHPLHCISHCLATAGPLHCISHCLATVGPPSGHCRTPFGHCRTPFWPDFQPNWPSFQPNWPSFQPNWPSFQPKFDTFRPKSTLFGQNRHFSAKIDTFLRFLGPKPKPIPMDTVFLVKTRYFMKNSKNH